MTEEKARRLANVKYHGDYIFAFDHINEAEQVVRGLKIWRRHSDKSTKLYVLSGYESQGAEEIASIFERIRILMEYQCLPYIMRHEYYNRSPYKGMFITLARWCNQPSFLKKKSFRQFCEANGLTSSAFRYMSEFEHDHPDIAKQYFDIRFDRHGAYGAWSLPIRPSIGISRPCAAFGGTRPFPLLHGYGRRKGK